MRVRLSLIACVLVVASGAVWACPFCNSTGTTLRQDAGNAGLILFGTLKNARLDTKEYAAGSTDMDIESVIKPHPFLGDRKMITLPRFIPVDPKKPGKYLVFCDIYKGKLDPYHGVPLNADSKVADYLKGALAIKDKDAATRLRFFFDFLDDADTHISQDAFNEFGNADYKEFRPLAEKLPAERVIKWLNDTSTPASRIGLYGSMLGHCGKPTDAPALLTLIDDPEKRTISGLDGVYAGLVMLTPKEGWGKLTATLSSPKVDFTVRFACLKAVQFLWEYRPDVIPRDKIADTVTQLTELPDIADLAIECLRKWSYWNSADKIIGLAKRPGYNDKLIVRSLIRYALQVPAGHAASAAANNFLTNQRKEHSEWVKDSESLLASETGIAPPVK